MKACKFCGMQVENTEQHCPSCGSAVFMHICENCGTRFDSGFCPNCGVKAGQVKKICPDCRSTYFTNACPNCGYTPSRKPVVQKVEQTVVHRHVYEQTPRPAPTPTQARRIKKKHKGCGCLGWFLIIIILAGIIGNSTPKKKSTTTSSTSTTKIQATSVSGTTAAPTATPEPAVLAAQEKVDQYFKKADKAEITAVREADSILDQLDAKASGKVILVKRDRNTDRGVLGETKSEPNYIGSLGYAAVYDDQQPEKNADFGNTPWKIPVFRKDKQFWEQTGTIDHKTEIVVIGQELEMPSRKYSTSRCTGYLHVICLDTGKDCWMDVGNYVNSPYWESSLDDAQKAGYCIAAFKQVSDYYPVTGGNKKAELEDGTLVLLPLRSKVYGYSPDKKNNTVPGVVFKQWSVSFGGETVWFNEADLTLTY